MQKLLVGQRTQKRNDVLLLLPAQFDIADQLALVGIQPAIALVFSICNPAATGGIESQHAGKSGRLPSCM